MRVRGAVALLLLALGTAGCPGEVPEPRALDTPAPAPSPSPEDSASPVPPPPPLPDKARGTSKAAARAFVAHYIELVNYAGRTGRTTRLALSSGQSCESCSDLIGLFRHTYEQGGSFSRGGWTAKSWFVPPGQPTDETIVNVVVSASKLVWTPSVSGAPTTSPGDTSHMEFRLSIRRGTWLVKELKRT